MISIQLRLPFRSSILNLGLRSTQALLVSCTLALAVNAHAQTTPATTSNQTPALDEASKSAMTQTQSLLKNQTEREKSMTSTDAKKTDQQVKDLMGSDTQGAYDLAAEIFPTLVTESGGDPIKMQATLTQLMKNPESLASKLTPDQLSKLKDLAKRVEARQPAANQH